MTSKERVLTTMAYGRADRVPINYGANAGVDGRLKAHFGLAGDDDEGLRLALGVDFRGVGATYVGPKLHMDIPECGIKVDNWGMHRRWVAHGTGGYWDYCRWPLRNADEQAVADWPMPCPDDFDYSGVAEDCRLRGEYAVHVGGPGLGDIINSNGMLRTMEQTLVDLITDNPAGLLLARRRTEINLEITRRTLEAAAGMVDFMWLGEDLGTQIAPLIGMDLFRRHIRPRHQQLVDLARAYDLPVMIHTCGSSSWAFEDFIEMGVAGVDTLQPEAADMSPRYLKDTFGGRLFFHGCISTAGPVACGTVGETIDDVTRTLEIMMPGGGYCLAPTHALQDNCPTQNVVAMYEAAKKYGRY